MSALTGIWNQIIALVTTTDAAMLVVAVLIIVGTSILVRGVGALGSATIAALAVFGLANYAQGVALKGQNAVASAGIEWQKLMDMHGAMLIAYFVAFLVLIAFCYFARSMILRR